MLKQEVKYVLDELGYALNSWLKITNISAIILSSDESIYPDEGMQIYFDHTNELLRLQKEDNAKVITYVDYSLILGFSLTKATTRKSPYKTGNMA